ncbi:MAG: hypothetical protein ABMA01_23365, partial [Chthoniobacteraceae bacterium]
MLRPLAWRTRALVVTVLAVVAQPLWAQSVLDVPAPVPPATITRSPDGRATIRAVRLDAPLRIDGKLDEPVYERVPPIS